MKMSSKPSRNNPTEIIFPTIFQKIISYQLISVALNSEEARAFLEKSVLDG